MKKKEMKEVAKKIAKLELIIQDPLSTTEAKKKAEKEIMNISFNVGNLSDLDSIDEMVQEILEKT